MTAEGRTDLAIQMINVLAEKDITPGDVQSICLSVMTFVYVKARAPKHMAPVIAADIAYHAITMLYGALTEEGGEK